MYLEILHFLEALPTCDRRRRRLDAKGTTAPGGFRLGWRYHFAAAVFRY